MNTKFTQIANYGHIIQKIFHQIHLDKERIIPIYFLKK